MSRKYFKCILLASCAVLFLNGCTVDIYVTPKTGSQKTITDEEILETAEKARLINPWGETQSLTVATEWAGVDFAAPPEEFTLEDGRVMTLSTYRYMTGIVEALYKSEDHELSYRQSNDLQDVALSGDHNFYSTEWDEKINGSTVHCLGDGKTVNLAYWDDSDDHFSISFNCNKIGAGLTAADLAHIIK